MDKWDELRTAYMVAKLGTVTAASSALGIHRATIIRHIDSLEAALGAKVFLRHARGYTMTETGRDLLRVASFTEEQFAQLAGRARGRTSDVSGDLIVTSVEMMAHFMVPALAEFSELYPDTRVQYVISGKLMSLDYGEAHVALRGGPKPEDPENVVQPFFRMKTGLYASDSYVDRFGLPRSAAQFGDHRFVMDEQRGLERPFQKWLGERVSDDDTVLRCANQRVRWQAILGGMGMGFCPAHEARSLGLQEVIAPKPEWDREFWLVTHVDLHRTAKVQAFLTILKDQVARS